MGGKRFEGRVILMAMNGSITKGRVYSPPNGSLL